MIGGCVPLPLAKSVYEVPAMWRSGLADIYARTGLAKKTMKTWEKFIKVLAKQRFCQIGDC